MKGIRYWTLLAAQSLGVAFILYLGIPLYRTLSHGPGKDRPGEYLLIPALCVVLVMQACYWTGRRIRPALRSGRALDGHLLLFFSRLSFTFAGSLFSITFLMRTADTKVSAFGLGTLLAVVFAQYCYARELEALARSLESPSTG